MRPEAPVFFIDRSLGSRQIAERLRSSGARVEVLADHFANDCADEEWLGAVGRRGWLVLTKDKRIRRRPNELAALRRAHAGVFIVTAGNRTGPEMGDLILAHLERMVELAAEAPRPFIALVRDRGVTIWNDSRAR